MSEFTGLLLLGLSPETFLAGSAALDGVKLWTSSMKNTTRQVKMKSEKVAAVKGPAWPAEPGVPR